MPSRDITHSQAPTQTWSSGARRVGPCSFWCLAVWSSGHTVGSRQSTGHHGSPGPCVHISQDTGGRNKLVTRSIVCRGNAQTWSHLGPLCHLPLWATGRALAGPPLYRPLQVGHGAEFAVDRAVQARWEHLPTANLAKLETLPAGSRALAPAARLPPGHKRIVTSSALQCVSVFPSGFHLGWHSLPMQKSWTGSGRVSASQYMSWTSTPS